jgi:hypothetical protein
MVRTVMSRLARVRITAAYAVILTCVTTTLLALDPMAQDLVIQHASTNLHNLSHGRVATLFDSAFIVDVSPIYEWLPGLVCLLAIGELLWGSGRMVIAFTVGHVGATLLVAVWLTAAIEMAWLPAELTRATDVGMSYGAVAVLGALTGAVPHPWRPMWVGWWLAVAAASQVMSAAIGDDFTYTGHAVALVLGMVVATRFGTPQRWTRPGVVLLVVASAFGHLLLTDGVPSPATAALAGAIGASLGAVVALSRRSTRKPRHDTASRHGPDCLLAEAARRGDPSAELVCRCLDPVGPP